MFCSHQKERHVRWEISSCNCPLISWVERSIPGHDDLAKTVSLLSWRLNRTHWKFILERQEILGPWWHWWATKKKKTRTAYLWLLGIEIILLYNLNHISLNFILLILQCLLLGRRTFRWWIPMCVLQRVWDKSVQFSSGMSQFSSVQSLSHVQLFSTPWIAAHQGSLSIINSRSSPKLMCIKSVMPSSHLILCRPFLLLPPNPSQRQGLFQWVNSSHEVAKVLEFPPQHQSFQWTPRTDLL